MKKLLSIILAVLMIATTIPIAFAADTETKALHIGELSLYNQYTTDGITAVDGAPADDTPSYAYWDYETKTLTLKNYTQTITAQESSSGSYYYGIYYENDINLVLIGKNTITVNTSNDTQNENTFGIWSPNSTITVTGDGSLDISSANRPFYAQNVILNCGGRISAITTATNTLATGIDASGKLEIQKGSVNIYGYGNAVLSSQLSISNADVTASSATNIFQIKNDVTIKDSKVKATHPDPDSNVYCYGIWSENGSIAIENSKVDVVATKGYVVTGIAIKAENNISIVNNSTVSASGGTAIRFDGDSCIISDSTVVANGTAGYVEGNRYNTNNYGIRGNGVSITNSTVAIVSEQSAFNNVPTVNADESVIFCGADEATANEAGVKSAENLSSAYSQKYVKITPIPELCLAGEHNTETVEAQAKTCTEAGWDAYVYCKDCTYTTKVEISASHNIDTVEAKAKTCTDIGWEAYEYCKDCTYSTYEEILSNGHTEETVNGYDATCTETGLTDGVKCSACGDTLTAQEVISAKGHADVNGDGICDNGGEPIETQEPDTPDTPDEPDEPSDEPTDDTTNDCNHLCHSGNWFLKIIWKIVNFFLKLFKAQQYCKCSAVHW